MRLDGQPPFYTELSDLYSCIGALSIEECDESLRNDGRVWVPKNRGHWRQSKKELKKLEQIFQKLIAIIS